MAEAMNFPFSRKPVEAPPDVGPSQRARRVAVVLGAGAARGWSHIGVMRELTAMGLRPDIVVGASIGAVIGACYAAGKLDGIEEFAREMTKRRMFGLLDLSFNGGGLIGGERLRKRLDAALGETRIEHLPIQFASVATEIGSGNEIWLSKGRLVDAVCASYALPGVFEPVRIGGRWLFDGAIVNPIPITVARALGADTVIAVSIVGDGAGRGAPIPHEPDDEEPPSTAAVPVAPPAGMLSSLTHTATTVLRRQWASGRGADAPGLASVMVNAFNITQDRITRARLAGDPPDAMITVKVGPIGIFEFHRAAELIEMGREGVRRAREDILAVADIETPAQ